MPLALLVLDACATPQVPRLPPPSPGLSDAEIDARVEFIARRLDASRWRGTWWNRGWWAADGVGIAIGVASAASTNDASERAAGIVTAALGAAGFVYQQAMPMRVRHGADPIRALPARTRAEKLARLARAQELLEYDAERSTVPINWQAHLANLLVAGAGAGIVAASGDRDEVALIQGLSELIGGELQFLTEPQRPRHDIEDYVRRFGVAAPRARRGGLQLAPAEGGLGLALRVQF